MYIFFCQTNGRGLGLAKIRYLLYLALRPLWRSVLSGAPSSLALRPLSAQYQRSMPFYLWHMRHDEYTSPSASPPDPDPDPYPRCAPLYHWKPSTPPPPPLFSQPGRYTPSSRGHQVRNPVFRRRSIIVSRQGTPYPLVAPPRRT